MNFKRFINIFKWVWLALVISAAVWYAAVNFDTIREYLSEISFLRIIASFLLLCAGKVLTADLTFHSLKPAGRSFSFNDAFSITTITQLGKYLPGGIWHFAGKFGIYKASGLSARDAGKPMVLENIWLIASAALIGTSSLLLSASPLACGYLPFLCQGTNGLLVIILAAFIWALASFLIERFIFSIQFSTAERLRIWFEQLALWIIFGFSFLLVFPLDLENAFILQAVSAFSISWISGYIAFFAPGGIGIRELVMAFLLSAFLPSSAITIFASIHRLLWIAAEIVLALISLLFIGFPTGISSDNELINDDKNTE